MPKKQAKPRRAELGGLITVWCTNYEQSHYLSESMIASRKKCVNLVSPSAVQCLKPTLSKHGGHIYVLFSKFEFINQHLIQTFVSTYYAGSII